jgi:hypothetical protein
VYIRVSRLFAVSAFALAFAEIFFASEFFIFERRAIRSNLLGKRDVFLRGARLGRLANKGDSPDANGAAHQVGFTESGHQDGSSMVRGFKEI